MNKVNLDYLRLMFVGDVPGGIEDVVKELRALGAGVKTVKSAQEGLDGLGTFKPHLIVVGQSVAEEADFEFLKNVRLLPPHLGGTLPAILLTVPGSESGRNYLNIGFQAHFESPLVLENLAETISNLTNWKNGKSVDLSYLEKLREMGGAASKPDIVDTVTRLFLENTPKVVEVIQQGLDNKDFEQASRAAHKLKSSSGNLGAEKLTQLLNRLEFFNSSNTFDDRPELLRSIRKECDIIYAILNNRRL